MKKWYVTAVTAVAMVFSISTASAQVYEESGGTDNQQMTQQQGEYLQIEDRQLPNEVRKAVEENYDGAQISEAYQKEKDGETHYRLVLTNQQGQTQEVFSDAQGNLKNKDESNSSEK